MMIKMISISLTIFLCVACNQTQVKKEQQHNISAERGIETPLSHDEVTGKRYALIIGNASYNTDPNIKALKNPVNDARDMRVLLKKVGFEVIYHENTKDRETMEIAVAKFTRKLEENRGVGLFYYAGHGIQAKGINYLIPTQVKIPTQVELKYRAMSANFVLEQMEAAKNKLNMIILDACRNNPLPAGRRSASKRGLASMNNPTGSIIIFATAAGESAYDGDEDNGLFTKHLLRGIKDYGYMPVESMLKKVRNAVEQETINEAVPQVPWEKSSLKGDFCFLGCTNPNNTQASRDVAIAQLQAKKEAEKAKRLEKEIERLKRTPNKAAEKRAEESEQRSRQSTPEIIQEAPIMMPSF